LKLTDVFGALLVSTAEAVYAMKQLIHGHRGEFGCEGDDYGTRVRIVRDITSTPSFRQQFGIAA
jgi:hypothetical protein